MDAHRETIGVNKVGYTPCPAQQHGGGGVCSKINQDSLGMWRRLSRPDCFPRFQGLGGLSNCELSQSDQSGFLKHSLCGALRPLSRIDHAALQPVKESA